MDKELGTLSEEELEAIQGTQNDEHLTKLATGESAEVTNMILRANITMSA